MPWKASVLGPGWPGLSHTRHRIRHASTTHTLAVLFLCGGFVGRSFLVGRPSAARGSSQVLSQHAQRKESQDADQVFDGFVEFLKAQQTDIIQELEEVEGESGETFSRDPWGALAGRTNTAGSGGITRVLQGGGIIEKGACSFTCIRKGILSAERAKTIRARQEDILAQAGDEYSAAALSMVLHTRSPLIPTFRSDVRIFSVKSADGRTTAWLGGGADLTPYYLDEADIQSFHQKYQDLCSNALAAQNYTYESMKKACDEYFYLPARQEHRGTGGIFFDDLPVDRQAMDFVKGVVAAWMPSWLPIVERHRQEKYSDRQRHWQLLRRGRYLEFNLLYDRGVKFGLANANPRVEGVMVSAPPIIAYEYNHEIEEGSPEAQMLEVLKSPRDWVMTK